MNTVLLPTALPFCNRTLTIRAVINENVILRVARVQGSLGDKHQTVGVDVCGY